MMYFLRLLGVCTIFLSAIARAEDPFACVDPDVRTAFLDRFQDMRGAYSTAGSPSTLLPEFPSQWDIVGSYSHSRGEQVVYTTEDSIGEAADEALAAMLDDGWRQTAYASPYERGGFRTSGTPRYASLCNPDNDVNASVRAVEQDGTVFVSVSHHADQGSCRQGAMRMATMRDGLMREVPLLIVDEKLISQLRPTGGGGGGDRYSAEAALIGLTDRSMLIADLNRQLSEQRWLPQGEWASDPMAGSAWFRETDSGEVRSGLLQIIQAGNNNAHISFTIRSVSKLAEQGVSSIWTSSISSQ